MAVILAYFNNVFSGEVDPFWPHVVLLSLSVLAGLAVGAGIIFESPKYSSTTHSVAIWLVIVGIGVESVCTISLFAFDEGISNTQQAKIIALERQARGREISKEQGLSVIAALKGHDSPAFGVTSTSSLEAGRYALSIWQLLRIATSKEISINFLKKDPEITSGMMLPRTMACGDGTTESDRVIEALWKNGVVETFFPVRSPIPGEEAKVVLGAPYFCGPNSIFVAPRIVDQEIWSRSGYTQ